MKKFLLRIAYLINKHYKTIEIKHEDVIKFNDTYFGIVSTSLNKRIGHIDTLNIEAHDISSILKHKIKSN